MKRALLAIGILALLVAAGGAGVVWWAQRYVQAPLPLSDAVVFEVPPGSNLSAVSRDLSQRGVIKHPQLWTWHARLNGLARKIHAGEYEIRAGSTPASVLDRMVRGEVLMRAVTVVEGTTFRQLLNTLAAQDRLKQTLTPLSEEQIMVQIGAPGVEPEGQFFPDTYHFAGGATDLSILKRAYTEMQTRLEAAWKTRAAELPLQTPYEALILASIVEKETALPTERARIAGVFIRRLRTGMRLQSDPTVIYGLGAAYDGDIRTRDLRGDTPFNTYTRNGLPPTPIALPGAESLRAVTQPEDTGAVFFVATGESDGSHHFSKTLEEHSAAIHRYLARTRGR